MKLIFFLFIIPLFTQEYLEKKTIENFESKVFTKNDFQILSNQKETLEVWMSEVFTSPDLLSNKSLFIQIKDSATNISHELLFKNPYMEFEFIDSIEVHLYSNGNGGELYFYFEDSKFTRHKIFIAKMNEVGWKKFSISLKNILNQRDYSMFGASKVIWKGLSIQCFDLKNKELILVIDDIFAFTRKKIILP